MKTAIKSLVALTLLVTSITVLSSTEQTKLTVKAYHNDNIRILDDNSVLFSGDSFRLSIAALTELYIYVFLIDSNNKIQQLKPINSSSLVSKDQSIFINA